MKNPFNAKRLALLSNQTADAFPVNRLLVLHKLLIRSPLTLQSSKDVTINVKNAEVVYERPGTLSTMLELNEAKSPTQSS